MSRRFFLYIFLVFLVVCAVVSWRFIIFNRTALLSQQQHATVIKIFPKDNLRDLLTRLHQKNIAADSYTVHIYARLTGLDKKIQVGEYRISNAMTMPQLLHEIAAGKVIIYHMTCIVISYSFVILIIIHLLFLAFQIPQGFQFR